VMCFKLSVLQILAEGIDSGQVHSRAVMYPLGALASRRHHQNNGPKARPSWRGWKRWASGAAEPMAGRCGRGESGPARRRRSQGDDAQLSCQNRNEVLANQKIRAMRCL